MPFPSSSFENPVWQALHSVHASLSIGNDLARRYPARVVPLAAIATNEAANMAALRELFEPGEHAYVLCEEGQQPPVSQPGLRVTTELPCWRMVFNPAMQLPDRQPFTIEPLGAEQAHEMVALTDVAFPGYFRAQTYRMGDYYGIREGATLVAMAGERMALPGAREVSAVCTRPGHTGRGYAAALIAHLLQQHAQAQLQSILHVSVTNTRAVQLYQHLGFARHKAVSFHRIEREST